MKKSFTLIEILVVVTIIGLLTAIGSSSYTLFNKQSRDSKRKTDLENIRMAVEMYRSDLGYYPDVLTDLTSGSYMSSIPTDPLNSQGYSYIYTALVSGCTTACTSYTLGTRLENLTTANCTTVTLAGCKTSAPTKNCNYCLGPYGTK